MSNATGTDQELAQGQPRGGNCLNVMEMDSWDRDMTNVGDRAGHLRSGAQLEGTAVAREALELLKGCLETIRVCVTILCIMDPQSHFGQFLAILNGTRSPGWSVFSLPAQGPILFSYISHLHLNYIR